MRIVYHLLVYEHTVFRCFILPRLTLMERTSLQRR